ncbi:LysR family transcriptional regulator [Solirubrobacter phytolaccae]|uniref:LysR family transcriptional regulator n=1 Tax=Solirubrobacter phytolaccae TaxID=1404360 RepID=A0A9X3S8V6_9ACTN|nr:LysR family transcriptional regulator [Solirubrobacter phytolaccae]MDA0181983.1 LysR family transcriptional regulator [Solirubrobacter phytolaccae]
MMELRRLRLLHELARRGTVAAVAEALDYSPSSVSVQLSELEREAGTQLLRKVGRTLQLTPAGHRLADHAAQALQQDEAVRAELASLSDAPRGRLRLAFLQTPALALLPGTLATLADAAPDLRVEVVQYETAPGIADLRSREVDLVVGSEYDVTPVPRHHDVHREDLLREAVHLVVPVDHPLAATEDPIPLAAVEHAAWAAGKPGTGHAAAVDHLCNRLGNFAPDIHHRTDDGLILRALVASGQAVTILPVLIATATPQVAARPIAEGEVERTIFTAARTAAARSPAILAVRKALAAAAANQSVIGQSTR